MKLKDRTLILDNFRRLLSNYSVDIQDIVRSAILDGVDIVKYIDVCKDNPFRLDQIRLGIKEGLDDVLFSLSGDALYKVRNLNDKSKIAEIVVQVSNGTLSDEHVAHLLQWVKDGRRVSGVELATVPKNLLSVYDIGMNYGVDMSVFNGGVYSSDYLTALVTMLKNKRSVEKFCDENKWSRSVIDLVSCNSANHMGWYEDWVKCIEPSMSYDQVYALKSLFTSMNRKASKNRLSIEEIRGISDIDYINVLIKACDDDMDLHEFLGIDKFSADSLYMSKRQSTKSKISGNLRGKRI